MKRSEAKTNPAIDLKLVEKYVYQLLATQLPAACYFHNFDHSRMMKKEAITLAKAHDLSASQQELLALAALFQHTGFTQSYENAIPTSQSIAQTYLTEQHYPSKRIQQVSQLIAIAPSQQRPQNLLEKIACDAYHAYLGLKKYRQRAARLRKELAYQATAVKVTDYEWELRSEAQLEQHYYYTQAAIDRYDSRKKINLQKAKRRAKEFKKSPTENTGNLSLTVNKAAITMFKTSLRNHIDLTAIADQKSNIMLSVSALLLTIGIPIFASNFSDHYLMLIPAGIFVFTCLGTMFFATLSTRPIKMNGQTNITQLDTGKTNLFFFGNFYNMKVETYRKAMKEVIAHAAYLDDSMINDLYYLGNSLGNKFSHLRTCYNVFIVGTIIFILSFVLCYSLVH